MLTDPQSAVCPLVPMKAPSSTTKPMALPSTSSPPPTHFGSGVIPSSLPPLSPHAPSRASSTKLPMPTKAPAPTLSIKAPTPTLSIKAPSPSSITNAPTTNRVPATASPTCVSKGKSKGTGKGKKTKNSKKKGKGGVRGGSKGKRGKDSKGQNIFYRGAGCTSSQPPQPKNVKKSKGKGSSSSFVDFVTISPSMPAARARAPMPVNVNVPVNVPVLSTRSAPFVVSNDLSPKTLIPTKAPTIAVASDSSVNISGVIKSNRAGDGVSTSSVSKAEATSVAMYGVIAFGGVVAIASTVHVLRRHFAKQPFSRIKTERQHLTALMKGLNGF